MSWTAQQSVNVGVTPNDGTGDPLRTAYTKLNANDANLYAAFSGAGVCNVANGGTGVGSAPTNGQILIGNGIGFTLATLTAGSNITITNNAGAITIAASGSGGSATVQYTTVTTNTTLSSAVNAVLVNAASGNVTITLPTAVGSNFPCYVKRIDNSSNTVTIVTTASQTIDGQSSTGIQFQYTAVTLISDGANWWLS